MAVILSVTRSQWTGLLRHTGALAGRWGVSLSSFEFVAGVVLLVVTSNSPAAFHAQPAPDMIQLTPAPFSAQAACR